MTRIGVIGMPGGWSSERLAAAVEAATGRGCLVNPDEMVLDLERGRVTWRDQDLAEFDALIVKKVGAAYSPRLPDRVEVLRFLEQKGVRIFSRPSRIAGVLSRLSCTTRLGLAGIPLPPTVVTEEEGEALAAVERFGRAVLKPLYSSKARGMVVVEHPARAREAIARFRQANPLIYVQQIVPHGGRDLGVSFLGGRYLATYARVGSETSWNTTVREGGRYEAHVPSSEVLAVAERAQGLFGLDFTGVDVVETPDGPRVFEVSAFGGFRGLWAAHGIDAAELLVRHVLERLHGR